MSEKSEAKRERQGALILLEGADCSGKTTLALALCQQAMADGCDCLYLHGSPWPGEVLAQHVRMFKQAQEALEHEAVVIVDHYWVAEQLYGAEYRGAPAYHPATLDELTLGLGSVMALCVPSSREAQTRMHAQRRAKGQEHFDEARGVVDRYYNLAHGRPDAAGDEYLDKATRDCSFAGRADVVVYDMIDNVPSNFAARLLDKARRHRRIAKGSEMLTAVRS